ncbi:hypothetical protein Tco_0706108 [Tanacetum coccineum]|uniref:Uncharacterized protein n=1 Tax=Tanacetum coccineum TaxID=301880 RepID=A0ABQ4Y7Z6_9ASTR
MLSSSLMRKAKLNDDLKKVDEKLDATKRKLQEPYQQAGNESQEGKEDIMDDVSAVHKENKREGVIVPIYALLKAAIEVELFLSQKSYNSPCLNDGTAEVTDVSFPVLVATAKSADMEHLNMSLEKLNDVGCKKLSEMIGVSRCESIKSS